MIVPPANFWPLVREVCDKHNVLLIADEVVTGFGRTGSMFGSRQWGVKSNIMCLAKSTNSGYVPLGATMVNDRVEAAWSKDSPLAAIMHGYTYSGHPLAFAAAVANLSVVMDEDLPSNAAKTGSYILEGFSKLTEFPSSGDVRGLGLMLAVELAHGRQFKEPCVPTDDLCVGRHILCREQVVWVRVRGNKMIRSPSLVFDRGHVDEAIEAIRGVFEKIDS